MANMAQSGDFFEFRGMVLEHNRNVNQQLISIEGHLQRQDGAKQEAHNAIWKGVREHEEKDTKEFQAIRNDLTEIKGMITAKLSYGKGFLAAIMVISSLFGGAIALVGSNLFTIFGR